MPSHARKLLRRGKDPAIDPREGQDATGLAEDGIPSTAFAPDAGPGTLAYNITHIGAQPAKAH